MRIAHNPQTGEYLGLQGGEWKSLRTASNTKGEKLYLDVDGWKPLNKGNAETPDSPKEESSFGRTLGLGARGVIEGVGDTAEMVAGGLPGMFLAKQIRSYVPQVDEALKMTERWGERAADALSLPVAKSEGEKLGVAATRGAATVLPSIAFGGIPSVAKGSPALAKFLTAAPFTQMASGAASGAAVEGVRQSGGGTAAQIAAGLGAGLIPPSLALGGIGVGRTAKAGSRALEALTEEGQRRIAAENIREVATHPDELIKKLENMEGEIIPGSKPTLGQVAEDSGIASMEKGRASSSEKRGLYGERYAEQNAARQADMEARTDAIAPESGLATADHGGILRGRFEDLYEGAKGRTREAYEAIDEGGVGSFNLEPLRDALSKEIPSSEFSEPLPGSVGRLLKKMDNYIQNGKLATFDDLNRMRSKFAEVAYIAGKNGKNELKKVANGMKRQVDEYLETSAEYADQPVMAQPGSAAYRAARREATELAKAKVAADNPMWDQVWGHLDADSLFRDFPDAKRELSQLHGRGLFARKGAGVPIDELADSLKIQGWLTPDADSSTLVEILKSKVRGKGRAAEELDNVLESAAQYPTGFSPEQAQAFQRAKQLRREQGQLFEEGFNQKMSRGQLRDDQIPGNYFKSGPAGDGAAKAFLLAFGDDPAAHATLREFVVNGFRKAGASNKSAATRLNAKETWLKQHDDFLWNFPELRKQLHDIVMLQKRDLARTQTADSLASVKGSPTAQNLATQAIGDTLLGRSLGKGGGLLRGGGLVRNVLAAPVNWAVPKLYGDANRTINSIIDDAFLDPTLALELLRKYKPYTPKVTLKDVIKNQARGATTSQVRGLLDALDEDEPKKKK